MSKYLNSYDTLFFIFPGKIFFILISFIRTGLLVIIILYKFVQIRTYLIKNNFIGPKYIFIFIEYDLQ